MCQSLKCQTAFVIGDEIISYCDGIWTHDLLVVNYLSQPLDSGYVLNKVLKKDFNAYVKMTVIV